VDGSVGDERSDGGARAGQAVTYTTNWWVEVNARSSILLEAQKKKFLSARASLHCTMNKQSTLSLGLVALSTVSGVHRHATRLGWKSLDSTFEHAPADRLAVLLHHTDLEASGRDRGKRKLDAARRARAVSLFIDLQPLSTCTCTATKPRMEQLLPLLIAVGVLRIALPKP
jgi:hypothetical protein